MVSTPHLQLPLIAAAQAQKHVTHNEALTGLDALLFLAVASRSVTSPPPTPADGERYLVRTPATGAWAGHEGELAVASDGGWRYFQPRDGWIARIVDENVTLGFNGSVWVGLLDPASLTALQNLSLLGVGTSADAANSFSFKGANVLLAGNSPGEDGNGDIRAKISKSAASNVASLLFQNAYSGRAELGLLGDDDLVLKLSADGANWVDAIRASASGGQLSVTNASADAHALNRASADARYLASVAQNLSTAQRAQLLANLGPGLAYSAGGMANGALNASVAGNALTISLRTAAGLNPSPGDPVTFLFRDGAAGNGNLTVLAQQSALSITIPAGATCGAASNVPLTLWIVAFNDAGSVRLGVVNCRAGNNVLALNGGLYSSTLISASANAAQIIYSGGAAISSRAMSVLGYVEYAAGLATAGAYSSAPTRAQLLTADTPLPGSIIQTSETFDIATRTTSATTAAATSLQGTITLRKPSNGVRIEFFGGGDCSAQGNTLFLDIRRDPSTLLSSGRSAMMAAIKSASLAGIIPLSFGATDFPGAAANQVYTLMAWTSGGTATLGARDGGSFTIPSVLRLSEIQV